MANNLRYLRELTNISGTELAKLLNISAHTYYAIENDKISFPEEIIIMISKIYQVSTAELFSCDLQNDIDLFRKLVEWAEMNREVRYAKAFQNLTGEEMSKHPYKQIRKSKSKIRSIKTDLIDITVDDVR